MTTTTTSRRAIDRPDTVAYAPDGSDPRPTMDHSSPESASSDAHNSRRATRRGPASPAASTPPSPVLVAPQGTNTAGRRVPSDTRGTDAAGIDVRPTKRQTSTEETPSDATDSGPAAEERLASEGATLLDPALCLAADVLDDIERVRIANQNRLRQLVRTGEDADGEERGFGLDPDHPDVMRLGLMVLTLEKVEHDATLELQRKLRKHPLGAWVKAQRGVGEKQGARLLAAIGDPYINSAKDAPRTVSALWAYCGLHVLPGGHATHGDHPVLASGDQPRDTDHSADDAHTSVVGVAAKRRKGERANWSTKAKTRAYLVAESCMKQLSQDCRDGHITLDARAAPAVPAQDPQDEGGHQGFAAQRNDAAPSCACSPYRVVYDQRRAHTAVTHPEWTDGHSHNDALRVAAKAILRDLWRAARDWHIGGTT